MIRSDAEVSYQQQRGGGCNDQLRYLLKLTKALTIQDEIDFEHKPKLKNYPPLLNIIKNIKEN